MVRVSILLVTLLLVMVLVIAVDSRSQAQALEFWNALKPVLVDLKEGLAVILDEITHNTRDMPSDNRPSPEAGPVYNAYLVTPANYSAF